MIATRSPAHPSRHDVDRRDHNQRQLPPPQVEVWKNRGCACCTAWAKHLAGWFHRRRRARGGRCRRDWRCRRCAGRLERCHTAKVAGYVVEGHVPAAAVHRLLAEQPALLGLAVPGMPLGSPGMEVEGQPAEPFDVMAFAGHGSRFVFMEARP
jgi:hypothetical protein